MHYEINVSLNGAHFFATNERSLRDIDKARLVHTALAKRFPVTQGYEITITRWDTQGTQLTSQQLNR